MNSLNNDYWAWNSANDAIISEFTLIGESFVGLNVALIDAGIFSMTKQASEVCHC
jgi:hypothetical protein